MRSIAPEAPRGKRTLAGGAKKLPSRYGVRIADDALDRAIAAHRRGDRAAAIAGYRDVVERRPDALDAWMNLGQLAALVGGHRAAIDAFARARDLAPRDARAARDAGIALVSLGRFDEAALDLARAAELDPNALGAWLYLVRALEGAGHAQAAHEAAIAATRAHPESADAWLEVARSRFDPSELAPSIEAAERAVTLAPAEHGLPGAWLACVRGLRGDRDGAERAASQLDAGFRARVDAFVWLAEQRTPRTRFASTKRGALLAAHDASCTVGAARVVELGVRHGTSLRWLAEATRDDVVGFDSFEGLPEAWQGRAAGAFTTEGELPEVPAHARLVVGRFEDTLPGFAAAHAQPIRLLHVDSDLYASAACSLSHLGPLLPDGAVVAFDEYVGNAGWRDEEHRAFVEAHASFGWRAELVAAGVLTGQAAFRIARK
jgi:tetratricopeptide (TPR) repeat protein